MIGLEFIVAGCVLALTVIVGLVAHEWSHALALRFGRIDYTVVYAPGSAGGLYRIVGPRPWAAVHPHLSGHESPWAIRVAALAPVLLALPVFGLGTAGVIPTDDPIAVAGTVGWLSCAIPSPRDFSVAFYATDLLQPDDEVLDDGSPIA